MNDMEQVLHPERLNVLSTTPEAAFKHWLFCIHEVQGVTRRRVSNRRLKIVPLLLKVIGVEYATIVVIAFTRTIFSTLPLKQHVLNVRK